MRREIKVILYHDISEDTHPLTKQLDVSISPELFVQHMRYFNQNFDLVSACDVLAGKLPRKPLLVTFDDAYRSVLLVGGPILKEFNAPSIFFINPVTVVSQTVPIDNVFAAAANELGFKRLLSLLRLKATSIRSTPQLINNIVPTLKLAELATIKQRILSTLRTTETHMYEASKLFLMPTDLTALTNYRIDIGNHSMNHFFFRGLSRFELRREIVESRMVLERISGVSVRCLSIPYGNEIDATESALAIARASAHRAIFLTHSKSNRFRPASDIYYRTNLGNTPPGALARKIYVEPVLRSIKNWVRSN